MSEVALIMKSAIAAIVNGARSAVAPRNRRVSAAVLIGGGTIAAANWIAMSQSAGESILGLGDGSAAGVIFAPAYGGLATGLVAGFNKRPVYADGRAGTYAAFAGIAILLVWTAVARITGDLPEGGMGFERFGLVSGLMFVLVVGSANMFVTFPTAFLVIFTSRSLIPNNKHRYGWLIDDDESPGIAIVARGPRGQQPDLRSKSTAFSRFSDAPPRFSKIPRRFVDVEPE